MNGIIVSIINVGVNVMIGVNINSGLFVVFGILFFFNNSFKILVIVCSKLNWFLIWFGLICFCINFIIFCFVKILYVMKLRIVNSRSIVNLKKMKKFV